MHNPKGKLSNVELFWTIATLYVAIANADFSDWVPQWMPDRTDLLCKSSCNSYTDRHDDCCACSSAATWEVDPEKSPQKLYVEYISTTGANLMVVSDETDEETQLSTHIRGQMSLLPENICNFTKIVSLDFSHNSIFMLRSLSCLSKLDTLNLAGNELEHFSNQTLVGLTYLRIIDISDNHIKTMDSAVLYNSYLRPLEVNIRNNNIQQLDVTNCIIKDPYCQINASYNKIDELTNELDFTLNTDTPAGPGLTSFAYNSFETFPDLQSLLHLNSIQELGSLLSFGFDFRDTKLKCDCYMEPFVELISVYNINKETFWRDYFDVSCNGPDELRNMTIDKALQHLDKFVCNVGPEKGCPIGCECIDQPSSDTLKIDCANAGLTELPHPLPYSRYSTKIALDVSNNSIQSLQSLAYLSNVTDLNISGNDLVFISDEAVALLQNVKMLNMSDNDNLKDISENFRYLNSCAIVLPSEVLECNCDTRWIKTWQDLKACPDYDYKCRLPSSAIVSVHTNWVNELACEEEKNWTVIIATQTVILLMVVIVACVMWVYRYELLILYLRTKRTKPATVAPMFQYDVFLSLDYEDRALMKWIVDFLLPSLERQGYHVFLSERDLPYGCIRDEETIHQIAQARTFLLILSESYLDQEGHVWTDNEWKYSWNMYKENVSKNIVLVNYDHLHSWHIDHPQIRAYLRVGQTVDFSNRDGEVIETIKTKLGPPASFHRKHLQNICNTKPMFTKQLLEEDMCC